MARPSPSSTQPLSVSAESSIPSPPRFHDQPQQSSSASSSSSSFSFSSSSSTSSLNTTPPPTSMSSQKSVAAVSGCISNDNSFLPSGSVNGKNDKEEEGGGRGSVLGTSSSAAAAASFPEISREGLESEKNEDLSGEGKGGGFSCFTAADANACTGSTNETGEGGEGGGGEKGSIRMDVENDEGRWEEDEEQHQNGIEELLVGSREDLKGLLEEYAGHEGYRQKVENLMSSCVAMRRVKKDGCCFYRSLLFGLFEWLVNHKSDISRYMTLIQKTRELVTKSRLLTSTYLMMYKDSFEPFLTNHDTIESFCSHEVDPMFVEAEHLQVTALTAVLETSLQVVYLDGSDASKLPVRHNFPEGSTPIVYLLYRPGHYDLIYPKN